MISKRTYLTILIMFITVFALFMFVGISSSFYNDSVINEQVSEKLSIGYEEILSSDSLNLETSIDLKNYDNKPCVAIISSNKDDLNNSQLVEWCVYHKYFFKIFITLPEVKDIEGFDVIIFGDYNLINEDDKILYDYADLGKIMIFTKLPNYQMLEANRPLAEFFGIDTLVSQNTIADGIRIFPDFMLGEERIYQRDDYFGSEDDTSISIPYYKLSAGYEVYSVGIFDDQKELEIDNKDLPPLLWRTRTRNSFVFVVNCDIFHGIPLLGVMTGFMTHSDEFYLYPIVNAQTISLVDYPYFSKENLTTISTIYSRSSEALSRDILWPNIIQILKNYGDSYNFFAASQLDYLDQVDADDKYINFYLGEINKLRGKMGLSLGQVSEANLNDIIDMNYDFFKEHLPAYKFTALFLSDFSTEEIRNTLKHELFSNISLIMSDYEPGDKLLDFIDDDVLSVKFNLDGYQHETWNDLQMKSTYNALGMSNMKVDIKRVIFPKDNFDEWNKLSLIWSRGKTYYKDYSKFDMVSIYEMEDRVRRFLAMDYIYEYNMNDVNVVIKNFNKEAFFILSVYDKSISSVKNGEAKKISNNTYLISANASEVSIRLKDDNVLNIPNSRAIPSHP